MSEPEDTTKRLKVLKAKRAGYRGHVTRILDTDTTEQGEDTPNPSMKLTQYKNTLEELDDEIQTLLESEDDIIQDVTEACELKDKITDFIGKLLKERYGRPQVILNAHMEALLDIPASNDPNRLRTTYDSLEMHLRGIEAMGKQVDSMMVVPLVLKKLPNEIRLFLSRQLGDDMWDLARLRTALSDEVQARERTVIRTHKGSGNGGRSENGNTGSFLAGSQNFPCQFCDGNHKPTDCSLTDDQRRSTAIDRRLCFCCLRNNHSAKKCRKRVACAVCQKKSHHVSLCGWYSKNQKAGTKQENDQNPDAKSQNEQATKGGTSAGPTPVLFSFTNQTVLMKTAVAPVSNVRNSATAEARLLFDDASQCTYVTQALVDKLGAETIKNVRMLVSHFGAAAPTKSNNAAVKLKVQCRDGTSVTIEAVVVNSIAPAMYRSEIDMSGNEPLESMDLADPRSIFESDFTVDILIGGTHYYDFVHGNIKRFPSGLVAVGTRVGWVLTGPANKLGSGSEVIGSFFVNSSLDEQVERFWDLETMGILPNDHKPDLDVLEQFEDTMQFSDSRYWVRFPWIAEKVGILPSNRELALRRFRALQRKLRRDPDLAEKYTAVMDDQFKRGFIEPVPDENSSEGPVHYIPHHAVVKTDSRTTKVRVVFDASAKMKGCISLNDAQSAGPKMIGDLFRILIEFRLQPVGIVSDIEKAFLQVGLQTVDRDCTRFFWTPDHNSLGFQVYRFSRVPFGIVSSPFLLNATVHHHLKLSDTPTAKMIQDCIYVDNCVASLSTATDAMHFYHSSKSILCQAGMNLREWTSNSEEFRSKLPPHDLVTNHNVKVLGLLWDTQKDHLSLKYADKGVTPVTKRRILSSLSSVYDPLGFATPIVTSCKVFFQKLWELGVGWDDPLPDELVAEWCQLESELRKVPQLGISRWTGTSVDENTEVHAFVDASKAAYCGVFYLVSFSDEAPAFAFLCSKTRVAPVKSKLTIPRLELMAISLGSKVLKTLSAFDCLRRLKRVIWSDSMIALSWVTGNGKTDTFVRNRVKDVQSIQTEFRYVPTTMNPADIATRYVSFDDFRNSEAWFHGPDSSEIKKYSVPFRAFEDSPADDTAASFITETHVAVEESKIPETPFGIQVNEFSSLKRLYGVTELCMKFVSKLRPRSEHETFSLTPMQLWAKWIQELAFPDIIKELAGGKQKKKSDLCRTLDLFLDSEGILRCGGRLQHSAILPTAIHPILLPKSHHITKLVIRDAHERAMHAGLSFTVSEVRQIYWIPQCKRQVKSVLRTCVTCKRWNAQPYPSPPHAPLPQFRVQCSAPFTYVGVDFAGPIGCKDAKVWICLFTCAATRAVHLEIVTSLSTESFLLCLRKFIARRGTPRKLISDNALTFKMAKNVLEKHWQLVVDSKEVGQWISAKGIKWQFNVERAPWWGGFFERMVGLVKRCLKKVLSNRKPPRTELDTQVAEVESVINSRPLTLVSDDLGYRPITPNDCLGLRNPSTFPRPVSEFDPDFMPNEDSVEAVSKRIAATQRVIETFWLRWKLEYITQLREYHYPKGKKDPIAPQVGEVVLVKDESPRNLWKLGLIVKLIPSNDGYIRAAAVKTEKSTLQRPIQLLIPLEIRSNANAAKKEEGLENSLAEMDIAATSGEEGLENPLVERNSAHINTEMSQYDEISRRPRIIKRVQ